MRAVLARLAVAALATGLVAASAPMALADGTEVGGSVPSLLALGLSTGGGLGRLPSATQDRSYDLSLGATVTASESPVLLTVTDGEAADGRTHGRLVTEHGPLADPLLVRGSARTWTSLADPGDAPIARWPGVLASQAATIRLRQRVPAGTAGTVAPKLLLVTVSVEGP